MAYATVPDYFTDNGLPVPENIDPAETTRITGLLDDATDAVDGYIRLARYAVDSNGAATDERVRTALRRATAKQAKYFDENPSARSEYVPQYDSITAGSLSLQTRASSTLAGTTSPVSQNALRILTNAGLFSPVVGH